MSEKDKELTDAADSGYAEKVKKLIKEGANVNAKDKDGNTALMYAAFMGNTDIVKILKEAGAKE